MWAALTLAAVLAQAPAPAADADEPQMLPPVASPDEPKMLPPDAPVPVARVRPGTRRYFPLALAIGAASLGVGAAVLAVSESIWQTLTAGPPGSVSIAEADQLARSGKAIQVAAAAFGGMGAAAGLVGLGLLLFGSDDVPLSVAPTPAGFAIAGTF